MDARQVQCDPAPSAARLRVALGESVHHQQWRIGVLADAAIRTEHKVMALSERLHVAIERGAPDEDMESVRAMFGIHNSRGVISKFRAWLGARDRYRATDPKAPNHEWLRREMGRACAEYEAVVGEPPGP